MSHDGPRAQSAPEVGLIHHLACSGGTIIARAIAAMPGVVLLSEQHPEQQMARRTDPVKQAQAAGAPITDFDVSDRFVRDIAFVADRCADAGQRLVVRDHTNRDFLGTDRCRLLTREVLGAAMPVRSVCTVRHPVDTWLSLQASGWFAGSVADFLSRYEAFARFAVELGFERYEDFVSKPDAVLGRLCGALQIPFDPEWRAALDTIDHMTGGSGRASNDIARRPRRKMPEGTLEAFAAEPVFPRVLDILGYGPAPAKEAA